MNCMIEINDLIVSKFFSFFNDWSLQFFEVMLKSQPPSEDKVMWIEF